VREDDKGSFYSVVINPLDPAAMSVMAQVQRRDISGSSFQFTLLPEDEAWSTTVRK
jgi:phage head maturation protease